MNKERALDIDTPRWSVPLLQPGRYKGSFGGRSSGKSHEAAERMIERHVDRKTDSVCIREVQKSLKYSAKRLLELKISSMGVGDLFNVLDARIDCPHGGLIIFEGMQNHNAESIKSLEGFDIAWIEEAQTISQHSLDLLRPTIMRKNGAEIWATWNPRHKTDPIDRLLRGDNPPPGSIVVNANYWDNPWFDEGLLGEVEYDKKRDFDKYQHIWEGGYIRNSEASVFKNWRIEEFESPADAIHRQGSDFGFNSPTTLVRSHIKGRTLFIDYEAFQINCEIDDIPDLFRQIPDSDKWPIIADSSRPETISYLRNHGFKKTYASVKGKDSLKEGVEFLKSYDIVVHPRCVYTIDELSEYKWKVDENIIDPVTNKPAILPVLVDEKNHIIDPLRYAHEGHRRAEKAKKRNTAFVPKPIHNPMAGNGRR